MGPDGRARRRSTRTSLRAAVDARARGRVEAVAVCLLFSLPASRRTSSAVGEALRAALPDVHVSLSQRGAARVPRVRALLDDRRRRLPRAAARAPTCGGSASGAERRAARAARDAVARAAWSTLDDGAPRARPRCVLSGPGRRRGGRRLRGARRRLRRRAHLRHGRHEHRRRAVVGGEAQADDRVGRGRACRSSCRWSTSTRSARAAARSRGSTRAARCASGPRSAGADPGPGRLRPRRRGADGDRREPRPRPPRRRRRARRRGRARPRARPRRRSRALGERLGLDALETARGIVAVADAEMVRALRVICVERGLDPRDFALVAFGGAGGLHACALAEELGMRAVLVPRAGGVLSALGLAISDAAARLRRAPLLGDARRRSTRRSRPSRSSRRARARTSTAPALRRRADLRYRGQSFELTVDGRRPRRARRALPRRARAALRLPRWTRSRSSSSTLRLVATVAGRQARAARGRRRPARRTRRAGAASTATGARSPVCGAATWAAARGSTGPRSSSSPRRPASSGRAGRATSTTRARSCWSVATVTPRPRHAVGPRAARSAGIAEEMGAVLVRGAYSSNIKERRDCSAALFDAAGRMVAQAEHIPVHLGAMPESVAAVIERDPQPGRRVGLNDPYARRHAPARHHARLAGGASTARSLGYAVTPRAPLRRRRHARRARCRRSREIYQEGLVIPPVRLVARRRVVEDVLELMLANVRTPEVRRGDLRAQIAANRLAERRLRRARRAARARRRRGRRSTRCSPTPSGARARRSRELPGRRATTARRRDRGRRRRRRGHPDPRRGDGRAATRCAIDFDGHRRPGRRQRQRPLAVTRVGVLLRAARAAARRRPGQRRLLRPARDRARPRARWSTRGAPAAVVAGNVETSPAHRRHRAARARRRRVDLPAAGPGHDEQPHHRRPRLDVLRDDRRRPGRRPAGAGPVAASTSA